MALEKDHDVLHVLLFLPTLADQSDTRFSDAGNFQQPFSVFLYYVESLQTEMRDDELGKLRAYALDQSATEIFLDADDGGRQFLRP